MTHSPDYTASQYVADMEAAGVRIVANEEGLWLGIMNMTNDGWKAYDLAHKRQNDSGLTTREIVDYVLS